ncbi:MAG: DUF4186 family protein [Deltaproteobacteria bacterium]
MIPAEEVMARLGRSSFRRRFRLGGLERNYTQARGLDGIPAHPPNDGNQTPMKGHPVFVAQHATATCCRKCLNRWHGMETGRELTEKEIAHVVDVIMRWIEKEMEGKWDSEEEDPKRQGRQLSLFET